MCVARRVSVTDMAVARVAVTGSVYEAEPNTAVPGPCTFICSV